jgi:hypothetical protein
MFIRLKSVLHESRREPTRCVVQNNLYSLACSILNFSLNVSHSVFTAFPLLQHLKPKNSEPTKLNKYPCVCVCVHVCVHTCIHTRGPAYSWFGCSWVKLISNEQPVLANFSHKECNRRTKKNKEISLLCPEH